jgi:hypothetical protein
MLTDYRTIVAGMTGAQAAAMGAAIATAARFGDLVLREGELTARAVLRALASPQATEPDTGNNAISSLCERQVELFRTCAGLPRFSVLVFLGELDRRRGRRPVSPSNGD